MCKKLGEIFNVAEKKIVITGATGYLGRYIAETFLEVGATVILLGRSEKLHKQISNYAIQFGKDKVHGFWVDFYKSNALANVLRGIVKKFEIDALINNAYDMGNRTGFNTSSGHFENLAYGHWKAAFEAGIYWAVLSTQIIGEQLKKRRRGSIVNISSIYGAVAPNPALYRGTKFFNPATYTVNKAGIIALTRYIASFWGKFNVRCNAVLPGPFPDVESKSKNSVQQSQFFLRRLKERTLLNKVGHPHDLRGILIYLASDASRFMTGQSIVIDGGWTIV